MRHGKKINHLGRKSAHRKAMLANMACSLIEHKRIKTTVAKAKALRVYVEPLLTKSKNDTTHSRRVVFSYLQNKYVLQELFGVISAKIMDRPGGYTRILKIGNRLGDNAEMAIIELVDFNEFAPGKLGSGKEKKRRRRGGKKGSAAAAGVVETVKEKLEDVKETVEDVIEDVVEEAEEIFEDVSEKVEEIAEEAMEEGKELIEDAREAVSDAVETVTGEEEESADTDDDKKS